MSIEKRETHPDSKPNIKTTDRNVADLETSNQNPPNKDTMPLLKDISLSAPKDYHLTQKKTQNTTILEILNKIQGPEETTQKIFKLRILNAVFKTHLIILLNFKQFNSDKDYLPVPIDLFKEKFKFSTNDLNLEHSRNTKTKQIAIHNLKEKLARKEMKVLEIFTDSESEDCHSQEKKIQNKKEDSSELVILTKTQFNEIQLQANADPIEISQNPVIIENDTKETEHTQIVISNPENQIIKDSTTAKETPLQLIKPQIIRNLECKLKERQPLIQKRDFIDFKDNSETPKGSLSFIYTENT